jgi:hypothetical protein
VFNKKKHILISILILVKRLVSQSICFANSTKRAQEFEPKPLGLNTTNKKAPQHWLQLKPYLFGLQQKSLNRLWVLIIGNILSYFFPLFSLGPIHIFLKKDG